MIDDRESTLSVNNSGLIIFWPFLTRFFEELSMVSDGEFANDVDKNRAAYLLQQLVFDGIDYPEYHLVLNRLLVGLPGDSPLSPIAKLSEDEITLCESLLNGMMTNWDKIENSSIEGVREAFLQREGLLIFKDEEIILKVEKKAVDVLLTAIPWDISLIKLPWMTKPIEVEWI